MKAKSIAKGEEMGGEEIRGDERKGGGDKLLTILD